jgi:hypothetical protein
MQTEAALKQGLPDAVVEIIPLEVAKPNLPDAIFQALRPLIRRVLDECETWTTVEAITHIHVSVGSGTPAIKQALTLLASSGVLGGADRVVSVYLADNPEQVAPGSDLVHRVEVGFIEELRLVPAIRDLLTARRWALAGDNLERLGRILGDLDRAAAAHTMAQLLDVFEVADHLAYGKARDALKRLRQGQEARRAMDSVPGLRDLFDAYTEILTRLAQGDRAAILYDLLTGIVHRVHREEYADALARAWSLLEAALRGRLHTHHGMDLDQQPRLSQAQEQVLGGILNIDNHHRLKREQYVYNLWEALRQLNDSAVQPLSTRSLPKALATELDGALRVQLSNADRLSDALRQALKLPHFRPKAYPVITAWPALRDYINVIRNQSVLAHGTHEVPPIAAHAAVLLARELLQRIESPAAALTGPTYLDQLTRCLDPVLQPTV